MRRSTDFVVGQTYAASSISTDPEPFLRLDDGALVHVSRLASAPEHHRILTLDQIGYRGEIPDWVGDVFARGECFLLFVERAPDRFECVGPVMACTFRSVKGKPCEIAFHVPNPDHEEAQPWSATAYIELTRSGDEWIARALGHDVSHGAHDLLEALAQVENELADVLLQHARAGEELVVAAPETSGMRALGQSPRLGDEAHSRFQRVVVRVGYYSAGLEIPGWAMSRDDCWAE